MRYRNFFDFFGGNFSVEFFLGFFWGFFLEDFLGRIFGGGFFWEDILSRFLQGIDVFVKIFGIILSQWKEEEGRILDP